MIGRDSRGRSILGRADGLEVGVPLAVAAEDVATVINGWSGLELLFAGLDILATEVTVDLRHILGRRV